MKPKPKRGSFDLEASLETLFLRAEADHDYSGCASLARVIRDVRKPSDPAPATSAGIDVSHLDADELRDLDDLLERFAALKQRCALRLGIEPPAPPPALDRPADPVPDPAPDPEEPDEEIEEVIVHPDGTPWTPEELATYEQVDVEEAEEAKAEEEDQPAS